MSIKLERSDTTESTNSTMKLTQPNKLEISVQSANRKNSLKYGSSSVSVEKDEDSNVLSRFGKDGRNFQDSSRSPVRSPNNDALLRFNRGAWSETAEFHAKKIWNLEFLPVMDPWENRYYAFLTITSLAVLYNVCVLLPRCAFDYLHNSQTIGAWHFLDYLSDTVYVIDIFTESRTGFLEDGMLVTNKKQLKSRYMKGRDFKIHVLAVIPTDILYFAFNVPLAVTRLNRLLRFPRLVEFLDRCWKITTYPNLWRFCVLIFYVCLFLHYNACLYYQTSKMIGFDNDTWVFNETLYQSPLGKYVFCFWWAANRLTTGDLPQGVTNTELIFVTVNILVGMLIFATLYGNIGEILTQLAGNMVKFHQWNSSVRLYMSKHKIPMALQKKVLDWMDHYWQENHSTAGNEDAALSILPENLRAEININAHLDTLRRVRIFQDCEPGLLVSLVNKLKLVLYNPGEYICVKGEVGKEMYIIKRGVLSVVSPDGSQVYSRLGAGAVLGELSLLNISGTKTGNRRTASVRSNGYSDLFCLTKEDLWAALQDFPDARRVFIQKGREILKKDGLLRDDYEHDEDSDLPFEERASLLDSRINDFSNSVSVLVFGWATHLHQTHKRIKKLENEIQKYENHRLTRAEQKKEREWQQQMEKDAERMMSELSNFSSTISSEEFLLLNRGD